MAEPVRYPRRIVRDGQPLRIGDRLPLPPAKLTIRPSSSADDPASSPRGVFRNGRGRG